MSTALTPALEDLSRIFPDLDAEKLQLARHSAGRGAPIYIHIPAHDDKPLLDLLVRPTHSASMDPEVFCRWLVGKIIEEGVVEQRRAALTGLLQWLHYSHFPPHRSVADEGPAVPTSDAAHVLHRLFPKLCFVGGLWGRAPDGLTAIATLHTLDRL